MSHPCAHQTTACYHCLRWLPGAQSDGVRFCGDACERAARTAYYSTEARGTWGPLHDHCRERKLKFPLLAARLACMVAQGAASAGHLDPLCRIAVGEHDCPPAWVEQQALLRDALQSVVPRPAISFLTLDWYCKLLAR